MKSKTSRLILDWFILGFGLVGVLLSILDCYWPNLITDMVANHLPSGLISALITVVGIDRLIQRRNLEEKIDKDFKNLLSQVEAMKGIDILSTPEEIHRHTTLALNHARRKIRVTNFKLVDENDTRREYYEQLNNVLKRENVRYHVAMQKDGDKKNRKDAFDAITDLSSKTLIGERMEFYLYDNPQRPMNVIIVDNQYAFIGFYTHKTDKHMQSVIKITATTESSEELISRLLNWYDDFVDPKHGSEGVSVMNGNDFLK